MRLRTVSPSRGTTCLCSRLIAAPTIFIAVVPLQTASHAGGQSAEAPLAASLVAHASETANQSRATIYEAIFQEVQGCVSVLTFEGEKVLYQNATSIQVFGDLSANVGGGIYDCLFALEPSAYSSMMESLQDKKPWKAILQVPPELSLATSTDVSKDETFFYGSRAFHLESWLSQRQQIVSPYSQNPPSPSQKQLIVTSPVSEVRNRLYKASMTCPVNIMSDDDEDEGTVKKGKPLRDKLRNRSSGALNLLHQAPSSPAQLQTGPSSNTNHNPPQRTMSFMKVGALFILNLLVGVELVSDAFVSLFPSHSKLAIASYSVGSQGSYSSPSNASAMASYQAGVHSVPSSMDAAGPIHQGTTSISHSETIKHMTMAEPGHKSLEKSLELSTDENTAELLLDELNKKQNEDNVPPSPRRSAPQVPSFPTIIEETPSGILQSQSTSDLSHTEQLQNRYHEVKAKTFVDPVTNQLAILLIQTDVTNKVVMEDLLVGMSEDQLGMLGGIFPKHVLEYLFFHRDRRDPALMGQLARNHRNVTILFMDIVGECLSHKCLL